MRLALCAVAALVLSGSAFGENKPAINKVQVSPTSPASGDEMFSHYCAACHGKDGKGNGPAAQALKKSPPDLTMLAKNNGGKFPALRVYTSVSGEFNMPAHGSPDMPIWGQVFRDMSRGNDSHVKLRISNLTNYIEKMQAK